MEREEHRLLYSQLGKVDSYFKVSNLTSGASRKQFRKPGVLTLLPNVMPQIRQYILLHDLMTTPASSVFLFIFLFPVGARLSCT